MDYLTQGYCYVPQDDKSEFLFQDIVQIMDQFPEVETCIEVNPCINIVICFCNFCAKGIVVYSLMLQWPFCISFA